MVRDTFESSWRVAGAFTDTSSPVEGWGQKPT